MALFRLSLIRQNYQIIAMNRLFAIVIPQPFGNLVGFCSGNLAQITAAIGG
jgi:hypothetical protein